MNTKKVIIEILCRILCLFLVFIIFAWSLGIQILENTVEHVIGNTVYTLIYFILPVIAFLLPLILKHSLKLSTKVNIVTSFLLVLIYGFTAFGTYFGVKTYLSEFTQAKWNKYPWERYNMLENMASEINFIGMTKEEVTDILGEPSAIPYANNDGLDLIDYYIGSLSIDPTMLTFVFEDNKTVEVYEYTEYRSTKKSLY